VEQCPVLRLVPGVTDEEESDGDEYGEGDGEEEQQHGSDSTQKNHNCTLLFFTKLDHSV
jgi:hypothetical protein